MNIILAALVISGAAFYNAYFRDRPGEGQFLEIRDDASGKVIKKFSMQEGEEFAIEFIHSVHQSPVRESFIIEDKVIRPISARFYSLGAGIQSDLDGDQVMSRDGDALLITGFNSSFRELNYIVGTVSDHLLIIGDETISLRDLCGKNAHIVIRISGGKTNESS